MNLTARIALVFLLVVSGLPGSICAQPFGPDKVIDTKAAGTMQRLRTTTAFNGWIYAAYSIISGTSGGITIRQSKDSGQTWTTVDSYLTNNVRYPTFDLVVTGSDVANLRLFLVGVNQNTGTNSYTLYIDGYNGDTGAFLGARFNSANGTIPILDVAIASDYVLPASVASPYGISIAWISGAAAGAGQIKYLFSTDAGATFSAANQQTVVTATGFYRSLSLAFGRSAAGSNGRYFLAWEELAAAPDRVGKIFTSRNTSTTSGPFITPVRLDDLTVATTNKCNTPKIAVQYSAVDSDGGGPTAVVMANCEYDATTATNILGFYNKQAHFVNVWSPLALARVGTGNQRNASVAYNTQNRTFVLTYLDEIANALIFKSSDFNLPEPNAWTLGSSNYASTVTGLAGTAPQIGFSPVSGASNFSWINRGAGADIAFFDSGAQFLALDVDQNQSVDALTDGLLVVRYMLGFRGNALINGAVGPNARRSTATEIEAHLRSLTQ